jgi:uncharacterized protein
MVNVDDAIEAIRAGDETRMRSLIEADSSIARARDPNGVSLLMLACYYRQPGIAEVLRSATSELDVFEAAALGDAEQLQATPANAQSWSADGFQPIHLASFFAKTDAIRALVQLRADVNAPAKNASAVRPIHSAAASRSAEAVKLLLEAGADPNVQQHGGWTPLHSAALHNDAVMVRLLLNRGANATLKSDDG